MSRLQFQSLLLHFSKLFSYNWTVLILFGFELEWEEKMVWKKQEVFSSGI